MDGLIAKLHPITQHKINLLLASFKPGYSILLPMELIGICVMKSDLSGRIKGGVELIASILVCYCV